MNNRIEKINNYPDDAKFMIQDKRSYMGNYIVFWGKGGSGYTSDVDRAEMYNKSDIIEYLDKNWFRDTDIIWPAEVILNNLKRCCDIQNVNRDLSIGGR